MELQALLSSGAKSRAKRTKRFPCLLRPPRLRFPPEATLVEVGVVVVGAVVQDVVGLSPGVVGVLLEAVQQTVMLLAQTHPLSTVLPLAPRIPQSLLSLTRLSSLSQSRMTSNRVPRFQAGRRPLLLSQRTPPLQPQFPERPLLG